jgi:hypothetical protein
MSENSTLRQDILTLIDDFIEQIQRIRKILFGMSVSAIVLAPLALALSIYLILHPSFFAVLEIENDFGFVLIILLGAVIMISGIWLFTGIKQYRSMSTWKSRYDQYSQQKEEIDRKIADQFGLDQQE